jgi:hypothetical protein
MRKLLSLAFFLSFCLLSSGQQLLHRIHETTQVFGTPVVMSESRLEYYPSTSSCQFLYDKRFNGEYGKKEFVSHPTWSEIKYYEWNGTSMALKYKDSIVQISNSDTVSVAYKYFGWNPQELISVTYRINNGASLTRTESRREYRMVRRRSTIMASPMQVQADYELLEVYRLTKVDDTAFANNGFMDAIRPSRVFEFRSDSTVLNLPDSLSSVDSTKWSRREYIYSLDSTYLSKYEYYYLPNTPIWDCFIEKSYTWNNGWSLIHKKTKKYRMQNNPVLGPQFQGIVIDYVSSTLADTSIVDEIKYYTWFYTTHSQPFANIDETFTLKRNAGSTYDTVFTQKFHYDTNFRMVYYKDYFNNPWFCSQDQMNYDELHHIFFGSQISRIDRWQNGQSLTPYIFEYYTLNSIEGTEHPIPLIYPNPTQGKIFVDGGFEKAEVFTLSGQLLARSEDEIDISYCPAGVYILRLFKDGISYRVKIVKQTD